SCQPNPHNRKDRLFGNHALPDREHVCVVMLAGEPRGLLIPAQRTTHTAHLVRRHRLTVPRAAKDYSALAFPSRNCFGSWPDEEWIINRFLARCAEVHDFVAELSEQFLHSFFVAEA